VAGSAAPVVWLQTTGTPQALGGESVERLLNRRAIIERQSNRRRHAIALGHASLSFPHCRHNRTYKSRLGWLREGKPDAACGAEGTVVA
jgi:hypothetical protein